MNGVLRFASRQRGHTRRGFLHQAQCHDHNWGDVPMQTLTRNWRWARASAVPALSHNCREAVLNADGSILQKAARSMADPPKPWSVKSKRKVDCNRPKCCAKQR